MVVRQPRGRERGQVLVLFAASALVMLLLAGLVVDGGYALAQRRNSQTAADLSALAGARVLASYVSKDFVNGTDANVKLSIDQTMAANGASPLTYGAPNGPRYVDSSGNLLGYVNTGAIPPTAVGVQVPSSKSWKPFFLGIVGVSSWSASATATARGGYRQGGAPAGNLLPIGVSEQTYNSSPICPAGVPVAQCTVVNLTEDGDGSGHLPGLPGGFGWLSFGCGDQPDVNGNLFGLGQNGNGCANNTPFLRGEWGDLSATPPVMPKSYGCCSEIGKPGSGDDIGKLPGNKASLDSSDPGVAYYIANGITAFVPIYDYVQTQNGGKPDYFHIIGYAGFQLVNVSGAKNISGVLRQIIFNGPTGTTAPGFAGAPLAVQLIK